MTLYPTSIRAKLTLTAVAVMGVVLLALGGIVQIGGRERIMLNVDAELSRRADDVIQAQKKAEKFMRPPPDGMGGPDGPGGPGGPGRNGDQGPFPGPEFGQGRGPNQSQSPSRSPDGKLEKNGPNRPGGNRGPGPRINAFRQALKDIGNHLLAIGPRFIAIDPGPPFAPPDMMEAYDKSVIPIATKKGIAYSDVTVDGQKVRIVTKLARDDNGRHWLAQVPYPLGDIDAAIGTLNQTLLLLLPIALLLTAAASLFLIKRVMRPIREIAVTADSISGEDLSRRLRVAGSDEFAKLGGTINGMLGRLESAFSIQRQTLERLEAVLKQQRRFTADASHELKTPLAVIKANTGLMLHGSDLSPDTRSSVEAVDSAATRMNRLVQGLMLLARAESGSPTIGAKPFDLKIAAQNAIDQVHRPNGKVVSFEEDNSTPMVSGSEKDVERVFVNLIDNACRHTKDAGHINVRVEQIGAEAIVTVEDDGDGIAAEHIPHLFERFYRADSARSSDTGGTGLGLAICKGIVEAAGGSISITSELGKGTAVTVKLPTVQD